MPHQDFERLADLLVISASTLRLLVAKSTSERKVREAMLLAEDIDSIAGCVRRIGTDGPETTGARLDA